MVKIIRRAVQWTLFFLFFVTFLSFIPSRSSSLNALLPKLQFFPALRRFALLPLIILIITFLFGRIFCSTLCPLATVQDLIIGRKKHFSHRKLSLPARYGVPFLSLIALFAGFPALAGLSDPYSLAGRMASSVNELVILPLIDLAGMVLRHFSVYITTYPVQFRWITIAASLASAALLFTMSRIGGRLYCNTLCPVGALLSLPAHFALLAPRINREKCTSCGACEKICKAEAIDAKAGSLDTSRCVSCFNCLDQCQFDALHYGPGKSRVIDGEGRRAFLKKLPLGSLLFMASPVLSQAQVKNDIAGGNAVTLPPGAVSRENFLSCCTACSLCVSRCPGNVLQPAGLIRHGLAGVGVPFMDFSRGSCEYDCHLCSTLCPSGAIRPITREVKKQVKIGEAVFVRETCVVETDGTSCGACGEICPTGAIDMVSLGQGNHGELEIPRIRSQYCIGCGACQYVCPVTEKNAIYVAPRSVQGKAELRKEEPEKSEEDVDNDFAF